jgi:hypothetical protein
MERRESCVVERIAAITEIFLLKDRNPRLPRTSGTCRTAWAYAVAVIAVIWLATGPTAGQDAPDRAKIGGSFAEHCILCHSGADAPMGLQLDTLDGAFEGSRTGPVVLPGNPAEAS